MFSKGSDRTTSLLTAMLVILLGVISAVVIIVLKYNIGKATDDYETIIMVNLSNKDDIEKLTEDIYIENFYVYSEVFSNSNSEFINKYDRDTIETEIRDILARLKENKTNDGYDDMLEIVDNEINEYLDLTGIAIENINTDKDFYEASSLDEEISTKIVNIIESLNKIESMIDDELDMAKDTLKFRLINISIISLISIIFIIATTVFIVYLCNIITSKLEDYNDVLEFKINEKNREISGHNVRIMNIQNSTIDAMASLIESRDGDTGTHIARTSAYVRKLAQLARKQGYFTNILTPNYIEFLVKAAPMHDIGKINVPDSILKKPGILTYDEYTTMQNHTKEGGRIIRETLGSIEEVEFINIASDVATFHHERWDGNGYPYGLKGEEIPISARIMAVADVFDALVSERCYKKSYSFDEAMDIISDNVGKHFDPVLGRLFVENKEDIRTIMNDLT